MSQITIDKVEYVDDLTLSILFSDGTKQTIDFTGFSKNTLIHSITNTPESRSSRSFGCVMEI